MTQPKPPKPYEIVLPTSGTLEDQTFRLLEEGDPYPGTDLEIEIDIEPANDDTVLPDTLPEVAWLDQAAGTVKVTHAERLGVGSYHVRFWVVNIDAERAPFPRGARAGLWVVSTDQRETSS